MPVHLSALAAAGVQLRAAFSYASVAGEASPCGAVSPREAREGTCPLPIRMAISAHPHGNLCASAPAAALLLSLVAFRRRKQLLGAMDHRAVELLEHSALALALRAAPWVRKRTQAQVAVREPWLPDEQPVTRSTRTRSRSEGDMTCRLGTA